MVINSGSLLVLKVEIDDMKIKRKNLKAYSLLELLVTLVVFAVLMTMITQVLLLSIESGRKISVRSKVRGDLSELVTMMRRDFRNAGKIDEDHCGESIFYTNPINGQEIIKSTNPTDACFFSVLGTNYAWIYGDNNQSLCPNGSICKLKEDINNNYQLFYQSSDVLFFDPGTTRFELQIFPKTNDHTTQGIFLASLSANTPPGSKLDVTTQYRQISVFTRNF